jgi:hypothetical protein
MATREIIYSLLSLFSKGHLSHTTQQVVYMYIATDKNKKNLEKQYVAN